MKSLGRTIFLLLITVVLQANVTAVIDKSRAQRGETVTYTLSIEGEKFSLPKIESLCGTEVTGPEHRKKTAEVEGAFQKTDLYSFRFEAKTDCIIKPILVEVDGVEHYTPQLLVSAYDDVQSDDSAVLELRSTKTDLYVGEPFELEIVFQQPDAFQGVSTLFVAPEMEHVWIKKAYEEITGKEGNYSVQTRRYLLAPQQAGDLRIYSAEVKVAYDEQERDSWGNLNTKRYWQSHYSNVLDLHVKALPEGVSAVGDFTIGLKSDTDKVEINTPFTAEIVIQGRGNLEDISLIIPEISGVDVFAEDPMLVTAAESGQEYWSQSLSFVSGNDFTIAPIMLEYFDLKESRVKSVQTVAVDIHVVGGAKIIDKEKIEGMTMMWPIIMYILGFITAALFLIVPWKRYSKRKQTAKVSASDYKRVLSLLLAHRDDEDVQEMIDALEGHLYNGDRAGIDQKELKKLLKKYHK